MSPKSPLSRHETPETVIRAIEQVMCSRCRGLVREKCRAQKEGARNASMAVCILQGPFDYCDEDYFTEVPIPGDPRFKRKEMT